jgi:hypothetical protein
MRTFKQGKVDLIEKVKREAIHRTFMDGDGCQAPGAIVIRKVKDDRGDGKPEYAVHFANTQCGGYHDGYYTSDLARAHRDFCDRLARYDPDGTRRASYMDGTGQPHTETDI